MESNEQEQESFFSGLAGISKLFIFILVLVIIAGIFLVLTDSEEPVEDEAETESASSTATSTDIETEVDTVSEESLSVSEQESGKSVHVSDIDINENRWVVIHEDLDGELGSILGARLFFNQGETEGDVELLNETEAGKSYRAVLYSLGEREKEKDRVFNTDIDLPLVDENGETVSFYFEVY